MKDALEFGPVSTLMYSNHSAFRFYAGGILNVPNCTYYLSNRDYTDHAVTMVGWGEENGIEYWIVKNSYGTNWGEQGYFRIQMMEQQGVCNIQRYMYQPYYQPSY